MDENKSALGGCGPFRGSCECLGDVRNKWLTNVNASFTIGGMDQQTSLELAIERLGGVKAFADALGESPQTITNWRARGVPANKCVAVEAATGISRRELRDDWRDYWPELAEAV